MSNGMWLMTLCSNITDIRGITGDHGDQESRHHLQGTTVTNSSQLLAHLLNFFKKLWKSRFLCEIRSYGNQFEFFSSMSFHCTSNMNHNFGFYVAHGGQLATSILLCLTQILHSNPTASQQISKPLTAPHLNTCHFSPLLLDLNISFNWLEFLLSFPVVWNKVQIFGELHQVLSTVLTLTTPELKVPVSKNSKQFTASQVCHDILHTYVNAHVILSKCNASLLLPPLPGRSHLSLQASQSVTPFP